MHPYPKYFLFFILASFCLITFRCKKDKNVSPPLYDFEYSKSAPAGDTLTFVPTCDSTVVLLSEYWDFGDGYSISAGAAPYVFHHYKVPGTYTVTMIPNGYSAYTVKKQITITPNFAFTYTGLPIVGDTIFFQFPGFLPIGTTCLWQFGDGNSSTDSIPYHIYGSNGTFTIKLTVNANHINSDTSESITIFNDPIYTHQMTTARSWYGIEYAYIPGGGPPYYNVYDTIPNDTFALTYVNELTIAYNSCNFIYAPSLSSGNATVFSCTTSPQSQLSTISYNHAIDSMTILTYSYSPAVGGVAVETDYIWTSH